MRRTWMSNTTSMRQADLFPKALPRGLHYQEDFLTAAEEAQLLEDIAQLSLTEAQYKEFTAKRRTLSYGSSYDFSTNTSMPAAPIAPFLHPLRCSVAAWAGVDPLAFEHALISEYRPGTPLGWHRDVPQFELIVGVSLLGVCRMRFRPYPWSPARRSEVFEVEVQPRSAYILRDETRWRWQHSIAPTTQQRYSITFRTRRRAVEPP
jgi:alkylated DNA repair dioxygenase AlkB